MTLTNSVPDDDQGARLNALLATLEITLASALDRIDVHIRALQQASKVEDAFREYVLSRLEELQRGQR